MTAAAAFRVDHDHDREHASDGVSRYGAYVRAATFEPYTDGDQVTELAVHAWTLATGPVMAPGYVRCHPRIRQARLERSDWDGSLIAAIDVVTGQPGPLQALRSDDDRGWWRDWPSEPNPWTGDSAWHEPSGQDLARSPYLLCQASLQFTVPQAGLARPPAQPGTPLLAAQCRDTVAALVRALSTIAGPVIGRIDGDRTSR
jgi:hypothetical protein